MPQGGVNDGEDLFVALKRELEEDKKRQAEKQKAQQAKFEEKMKKDEEQVKALLASLVEKHEAKVISATNGLRHIVTKPGSGDSPEKGDTITVNLVFKLADGKVIDDTSKKSVGRASPWGPGGRRWE